MLELYRAALRARRALPGLHSDGPRVARRPDRRARLLPRVGAALRGQPLGWAARPAGAARSWSPAQRSSTGCCPTTRAPGWPLADPRAAPPAGPTARRAAAPCARSRDRCATMCTMSPSAPSVERTAPAVAGSGDVRPASALWTSPRGWAVAALLVLLGVFVLGATAVRFAPPGSSVAVWWPAAGLAAAFLLATGPDRRRAAVVVIGVVVFSGLANWYGGRPPFTALCFGVANAAESAVIWALMTRGGRQPRLAGARGPRPAAAGRTGRRRDVRRARGARRALHARRHLPAHGVCRRRLARRRRPDHRPARPRGPHPLAPGPARRGCRPVGGAARGDVLDLRVADWACRWCSSRCRCWSGARPGSTCAASPSSCSSSGCSRSCSRPSTADRSPRRRGRTAYVPRRWAR